MSYLWMIGLVMQLFSCGANLEDHPPAFSQKRSSPLDLIFDTCASASSSHFFGWWSRTYLLFLRGRNHVEKEHVLLMHSFTARNVALEDSSTFHLHAEFGFRCVCNPDFCCFKIPMHDDLQKDIFSLETLSQIALVSIVVRHLPGCRIPIRISALSDNTAAESVSNKPFSSQMPLDCFLNDCQSWFHHQQLKSMWTILLVQSVVGTSKVNFH